MNDKAWAYIAVINLEVKWRQSRGKIIPAQHMKAYNRVELQHSFLTTGLDGGEWPASRKRRFTSYRTGEE